MLIVFMPVAGFLSMTRHEESLLAELENSMVQQGRVVAAWLAEGELSPDRAMRVVDSLMRRHTARIRVVDASGALLADSSGSGAPPKAASPESRPVAENSAPPAESTLLYRVLSFPVRFLRKYVAFPEPPLESADYYSGKSILDGTEIASALRGSYGAVTRISSGGQASVTLYSAIPVKRGDKALGAVLVSQSTYRIMADLYEFRLEIGRIFVFSLATATLVSLLLAFTISKPLSRLRSEAEAAARGTSLEGVTFHVTGRGDEIDRLSASLSRLVADLDAQLKDSSQFAGDAAHEMKNRIAGVRNSAELLAGSGDAGARKAAALILEDTHRMERAISALRELSLIEASRAGTETAEPLPVVEGIALSLGAKYPEIDIAIPSGELPRGTAVSISGEHLEIVVENLMDNAASFSRNGSSVTVGCRLVGRFMELSVADRGPGIPEGHERRVFDRFFTWRPEGGDHAGIGLALVEAIVRKAGGSVSCSNREGGGAVFRILLPVARGPGRCPVLREASPRKA